MKRNISFGTIDITRNAKDIINQVIKTTRVSQGKYVRDFEKRFASLFDRKYGVAVSSGTDAIALALSTLYDFGAKRGDEIILPALTFIGTANAVLMAGFKPVFVDVEIDTLNINPSLIEKSITKKTRAILPVHLMGKPCNMDEVIKISKEYNLFLIEDAAEAHGSEYKGKKIGSFGDMSCFSTYIAHIISTIEGGIVLTDNSEYADILRSLRTHGRACKCEVCVINLGSNYCKKRFKYGKDIRFVFERVGFSSKMNEIEAAVGIGNIEIFDKILKQRRKNLISLMKKFKEFGKYFYIIEEKPFEKIAPHGFPLVIKEKNKINRNELIIYLAENGIDTRDLFSSIPTQCDGYKFLGYRYGEFPIAEYIGENGLHFGVHQDLNEDDIEYIFNTVKRFIKEKL